MSKNQWYTQEQDAYLARRIRQSQVGALPYGRRKAVYQKISQEFQQKFRVKRSWIGIQQRARLLAFKEEKS